MIQKYKARVIKNIQETPTVNTIVLKLDKDLEFKAGQYVMIDVPKNDTFIKKPYSISSSPSRKNEIELCIKKVKDGLASNFLCCINKEEDVNLIGPMGIFTLKNNNNIIFFAGGSGIGPFRSILQEMFEQETKKNIWLFFGVRTEDEIIYKEEFEKLAKENDNFKFIPVLSRQDWKGEKGHVQDVFSKYVKDFKGKDAYVCGVQKMVEDVNEFLLKLGFNKENIHVEKYV